MAWSLASLRVLDPALWAAIEARVLPHAPQLPPKDVVTLLYGKCVLMFMYPH